LDHVAGMKAFKSSPELLMATERKILDLEIQSLVREQPTKKLSNGCFPAVITSYDQRGSIFETKLDIAQQPKILDFHVIDIQSTPPSLKFATIHLVNEKQASSES
jgi:hypothetical protein